MSTIEPLAGCLADPKDPKFDLMMPATLRSSKFEQNGPASPESYKPEIPIK